MKCSLGANTKTRKKGRKKCGGTNKEERRKGRRDQVGYLGNE